MNFNLHYYLFATPPPFEFNIVDYAIIVSTFYNSIYIIYIRIEQWVLTRYWNIEKFKKPQKF